MFWKSNLYSIFTVCCNIKRSNNTKVQNDNFIVVTESSDHGRSSPMNSLQKVIKRSNVSMIKGTRVLER